MNEEMIKRLMNIREMILIRKDEYDIISSIDDIICDLIKDQIPSEEID